MKRLFYTFVEFFSAYVGSCFIAGLLDVLVRCYSAARKIDSSLCAGDSKF